MDPVDLLDPQQGPTSAPVRLPRNGVWGLQHTVLIVLPDFRIRNEVAGLQIPVLLSTADCKSAVT